MYTLQRPAFRFSLEDNTYQQTGATKRSKQTSCSGVVPRAREAGSDTTYITSRTRGLQEMKGVETVACKLTPKRL